MKTIKEDVSAELVEKRSRFIAEIFHVEKEEEAEEKIKQIRKKYYDAKHVCFAYSVLCNNQVKIKSSDDGEPSGTAGKPLLGIIEKNNLQNILIVVTRYFGGILLGTGGLLRAYSGAAISALNMSKIIELEDGVQLKIEIKYEDNELFKYYCTKNKIKIIDTIYNQNIIYIIELSNENFKKLTEYYETKNEKTTGNIVSMVEMCRKYIEKVE